MSCFKRILSAPVIIFLVLLFGYFTYFLTTFFGFDFRIIIGLFILSFFLPFLFKYSEIAFGFFLTASFFKADLRLLSIFPAFFNLTILDKPVLGNRQHYLRWKMPDTWRVLERASLKYDTTLGFADHEGFCYGICYPYSSFDILGNRVFAICIWEVSLIAMEGGVFSYKSHSFSFKKAQIIIARLTQERIMLNRGFGVKHNKIRMIPNGVDEKFIYGDSKLFCSKYGFKNFVLYVGQIGNPRKNLLRLIKVAKFLKDIEFVLIGPILETPYAQRMISAAKDLNNVYILGRVPEEELISAYAACKVFILPSLIEGTGLVALEAGLAGANIVVTNRGGTIDYFKNYAIMINPTTKGILQGIKEALRRPSNPKQREIILNNFTWKIVVRKLLSIYKEFS